VTAAALGAALIAVSPAAAQVPDTTRPGISTSTTPTAAPQRNGNPPAAPSTSTGNGNWYIGGPVTTAVTASDDVGVTSLQYSIDDGATWVDLPVTGGNLPPATGEGRTSYRLRASDAAGNRARGATDLPVRVLAD